MILFCSLGGFLRFEVGAFPLAGGMPDVEHPAGVGPRAALIGPDGNTELGHDSLLPERIRNGYGSRFSGI